VKPEPLQLTPDERAQLRRVRERVKLGSRAQRQADLDLAAQAILARVLGTSFDPTTPLLRSHALGTVRALGTDTRVRWLPIEDALATWDWVGCVRLHEGRWFCDGFAPRSAYAKQIGVLGEFALFGVGTRVRVADEVLVWPDRDVRQTCLELPRVGVGLVCPWCFNDAPCDAGPCNDAKRRRTVSAQEETRCIS
jgi:hypothetical protein